MGINYRWRYFLLGSLWKGLALPNNNRLIAAIVTDGTYTRIRAIFDDGRAANEFLFDEAWIQMMNRMFNSGNLEAHVFVKNQLAANPNTFFDKAVSNAGVHLAWDGNFNYWPYYENNVELVGKNSGFKVSMTTYNPGWFDLS